jgi:plastocyanin
MNRVSTRILRLTTLLLALLFLPASPAFVLAQDATPSPGDAPHPAHIHSGTCAELGDVVFPLSDIAGAGHMMDGDMMAATPGGMGMMNHDGTPMPGDMGDMMQEMSVTEVEASLDDILAAEHAINVHESAENIGNYIACGDLTGEPDDGELFIELQELNDSGYSGEAELVDNGDGTTTVTVMLWKGAASETASPETGGTSNEAGTYEVVIANFAYSPAELTIKVGESVTFTNQDSAPHTATARERDVLQTGRLDQGESITITFDTPGTYEYFCEFHPNMSGTIIVE